MPPDTRQPIAGPRRRTLTWLGLTAGALFTAATLGLAGCGGGEDLSLAKVRLVNASIAYDALDLVVDDKLVQGAVVYGATASYAGVDPSENATRISRAGSPAALVSLTPALSEGDRYSIVAFGGEGALRAAVLDDNASAPDRGKARLRVLNGAAEAGTLDVYLTADDVALADAEPLHAAAAAGVTTAFATVDAATWRLRVTAAGDRDDLRLDLSGLVLDSQQVASLVVTPGAGGVLVNALVLSQGGEIERLDGAQARVRAVAGVTDSGTVAAGVGGVALLDGVGAPAIGSYRLVPAGAPAATVTVNGTAVAVPAADLAAGTDHTLLVWGPAAAPAVAWVADDNRPPAIAGRAKLRLLHGVAGLAGPMALKLNFEPLAEGVAPGTASAPALALATSQALLEVTATGVPTPLFTATEQVLQADRVYTLFMLGPLDAPRGVLYPDR